jgi:hypothetical protein
LSKNIPWGLKGREARLYPKVETKLRVGKKEIIIIFTLPNEFRPKERALPHFSDT